MTELPFGVSARAVLEDIERAINPKPREGKKSLTPEQLHLKTMMAGALAIIWTLGIFALFSRISTIALAFKLRTIGEREHLDLGGRAPA